MTGAVSTAKSGLVLAGVALTMFMVFFGIIYAGFLSIEHSLLAFALGVVPAGVLSILAFSAAETPSIRGHRVLRRLVRGVPGVGLYCLGGLGWVHTTWVTTPTWAAQAIAAAIILATLAEAYLTVKPTESGSSRKGLAE